MIATSAEEDKKPKICMCLQCAVCIMFNFVMIKRSIKVLVSICARAFMKCMAMGIGDHSVIRNSITIIRYSNNNDTNVKNKSRRKMEQFDDY